MSFAAPLVAGLTIASGAISAYGQYQAAKGAQRASEFNVKSSIKQAELVKQSAAFDKVRAIKQKKTFLSRQRALYAKGGVRLEGSPLLVLADTAAILEQDIQIEEFNAQIEDSKLRTQAELYRMNTRTAALHGIIAPTATLLKTATKATDFFVKR